MLKLNIGYPTREEERKILDAMATTSPKLDVEAVITQQEILEARKAVDAIHVADPIRDYVVSLVLATRGQHPGGPDLAKFLQFGASPRATINLTLAAKAWAFLQGRDHVTPQDVKDIAPRRPPPPPHPHLRSRRRRGRRRRHRAPRARRRRRPLSLPATVAPARPDQPAGDPSPRPARRARRHARGQRRDGRRLPLALQGPRDGLRGTARIRPGRRRALDGLERHRAHG
jgi:hypothetical protein